MSMVERIIFDVIKDGLAWYVAKPARFERFLLDLELDAEEAAHGRLYFGGGTAPDGSTVPARPPTLVHGYARTGGPFPCWALTLGAERIDTDVLGREAGFLDEDGEVILDEDGNVTDSKMRRMAYTFNILVHADHPDVCVWYYALLKSIVMESQETLEANDVEDLEFTGQDMAPDPRYLPDNLFTRLFQLVVRADETWGVPVTRGTRTTGLFTDDDGSGAVAGSGTEKALVTPYTED